MALPVSQPHEALQHVPDLQDPVTGQPHGPGSRLLRLWNYDDPTRRLKWYPRIVKSLATETARIPCEVAIEGLESYHDVAELHMSFVNMYTTPAIRISLDFSPSMTDTSAPAPIVTIDIMFCQSTFETDDDIQDFAVNREEGDVVTLTFTFQRAFVKGVSNLMSCPNLGVDAEDIEAALNTCKRGKRRLVTLLVFLGGEARRTRDEFADVVVYLPGQGKQQLPSLSLPSNHGPRALLQHILRPGRNDHQMIELDQLVKSHFPFTPLPAEDVFNTKEHYAIELGLAAYFAGAEKRLARQAISQQGLDVDLFVFNGQHIIGIPTGPSSTMLSQHWPISLLKISNGSLAVVRLQNGLDLLAVAIESYKGVFKGYDVVLRALHGDRDIPDGIWPVGGLRIRHGQSRLLLHQSNHTFSTQMDTLEAITRCSSTDKRLQLLLNNDRHNLDEFGLFDDMPLREIMPADKWLDGIGRWNRDQLKIIKNIGLKKSALSIIAGPAGTGKSRLVAALAVALAVFGYHVILIAPSWKNATKLAEQLNDWRHAADESKRFNVKFGHVHANSLFVDADQMPAEQLKVRNLGHEARAALTFNEYLYTLAELKANNGQLSGGSELQDSCNIVHQVVYLSRDCPEKELEERFKGFPHKADRWFPFFALRSAYRDYMHNPDVFDMRIEDIRIAFEQCKMMVMESTRLVVVASNNFSCSEIQKHFAPSVQKSRGVYVLFDEAFKAQELDVVSTLFGSHDIERITLLGDPSQSTPGRSAGSLSDPIFNPYEARLKLSLPQRLMNTSWQVETLNVQERMHPNIARMIESLIYPGCVRDQDQPDLLPNKYPGLAETLNAALHPRSQAAGEDVRLRWVEIAGQREKDNYESIRVQAHVEYLGYILLPRLCEYFTRDSMPDIKRCVAVVCAYGYTAKSLRQTLEQQGIPPQHRPTIVLLDEFQGSEADIVILDLAAQHRDNLGFVGREGRDIVALTRAREVLWIIGGPMDYMYRDRQQSLLGNVHDWREDHDYISRAGRWGPDVTTGVVQSSG